MLVHQKAPHWVPLRVGAALVDSFACRFLFPHLHRANSESMENETPFRESAAQHRQIHVPAQHIPSENRVVEIELPTVPPMSKMKLHQRSGVEI